MKRLMVWLGLAVVPLSTVLAAQSKYGQLEGRVILRDSSGTVSSRPMGLAIPPEWKGAVRLVLPGVTVETAAVDWVRHGETADIGMIFTGLPGAQAGTVVALKGTYSTTEGYSGEVLTPKTENADVKSLMHELLSARTDQSFTRKGFFYLTGVSTAQKARHKIQTGSPDNPCPEGYPCWSTGGVGRFAEYYTQPPRVVENRGPATFMRGVPDEWTRAGQLEAQRIGIERYRALQEHIDAYARPWWGWGWFWLWW